MIEIKENLKISQEFNGILNALMKKKGIAVSQLAANTGLALPTLYRLMADHRPSNPTLSSLKPLAEFFGISVSQLIGEAPLDIDAISRGYKENIYLWKSIPFFEKMTQLETWLSSSELKASAQTISTDAQVTEKAFGLLVQDQSMSPPFLEGSILIFEPSLEVYDRAYVLVKLAQYDQIVFKQIIFDEPYRYLQSVGNSFFEKNQIILNAEDELIGVLIQSKMNFK